MMGREVAAAGIDASVSILKMFFALRAYSLPALGLALRSTDGGATQRWAARAASLGAAVHLALHPSLGCSGTIRSRRYRRSLHPCFAPARFFAQARAPYLRRARSTALAEQASPPPRPRSHPASCSCSRTSRRRELAREPHDRQREQRAPEARLHQGRRAPGVVGFGRDDPDGALRQGARAAGPRRRQAARDGVRAHVPHGAADAREPRRSSARSAACSRTRRAQRTFRRSISPRARSASAPRWPRSPA